MKTKALTAAQIDTLAQRLSENPIEPATSAKKAGDTFARLLAEQIGTERAALAFASIMTATTAEQADARLTLVLDYGNTETAADMIPVPTDEPKAATVPVIGKRQAIRDQAQSGALPPAPDFSKPTHARFRAKLAQIVALAEAGPVIALEPKAAATPVIGKRQAILDQAQTGALPPAPDFSKPTHARFRAKLAQVVTLAEVGDIAALQAFEINPVSSSPKAMARYRDLCVIAITARMGAAA